MEYNSIKNLNINGAVVDIEIVDSNIVAVDNTYTLYYIDKERFNVKKSTTVSKKFKPKHPFLKSSSISKNGSISLGLSESTKSLYLSQKTQQKKVIDFHLKEIEQTTFSDCSSYFVTGGTDGKVFVFDHKHLSHPLISLEPEADFISNITFSKNSKRLASSSFQKLTKIFDFDTNKIVAQFTTPSVVEDCKFFDNNKKIYLITQDGKSIIYDIEKKEITNCENLFEIWPTVVALDKTEKYAIVGSRKSTLYIVDITQNKKIATLNTKHIGLTTIKFYRDYLILGFSDGYIEIVEYMHNTQAINIALKIKNYQKAKEILSSNPFLYITNAKEMFDNAWSGVLKNAVELISIDKIEYATKMVQPFITDDTKRADEFSFYLSQKGVVADFNSLIEQKEYIKAMNLADKHQYLQTLTHYKIVDSHYKSSFERAKVLLNDDPIKNKMEAIKVLAPFKKIASKERLVTELIQNIDMFVKVDKLVKEQKFGDYYFFCEKYKFLQDTQLFEKINTLAQRFYTTAIEQIQINEYEKAKATLKKLELFTPYKERSQTLQKEINYKLDFAKAIETNDKKLAYSIVKNYETIKYTKEYTLLEKEFEARCEMAKEFVYKTNIQQALDTLKEYLDIEYLKDKIDSIIKLGYILEIKEVIEIDSVDINQIIKNYASYYGIDSQIKDLFEKSNKSKVINTIQSTQDSIKPIVIPEYVDTIVAYKQ